MGLHDSPDDGEPEARARRRCPGVAATPPRVEDARQILLGNAPAAVRDREDHTVRGTGRRHGDRAVGRRATDRVHKEVAEDAAHLLAVDLDGNPVDAVADETYAVFAGERVGARERVAHEVVEGDPGRAQDEGPRVDARQLEEVAHHVVHALDLGADLTQIAVRVGRHTVLQGLGHRAESGERGAQIVRDPGDELATRGLQGALAVPGGGQLGAGGLQLP